MTETPTTLEEALLGLAEATENETGPITKSELEAVAACLPLVKRMWEAELAAPKKPVVPVRRPMPRRRRKPL